MSKIVTVKMEVEVNDTRYEFFKELYETYGTQDALAFLSIVAPRGKNFEIVLDNDEKA